MEKEQIAKSYQEITKKLLKITNKKILTCKIQRGCHWYLGFRSFRNWHQSNHHGHRIGKRKVEGGVFPLCKERVCMVLVVGDGMGRGLGGMGVGVHRDGRQLRP